MSRRFLLPSDMDQLKCENSYDFIEGTFLAMLA